MSETRRGTGRPCDWCDKTLSRAYITGDDGARYCSRKCEGACSALHGAAPALLAACEKMLAVLIEHGRRDVDEWKHDKREAIIDAHAAIAEAKV